MKKYLVKFEVEVEIIAKDEGELAKLANEVSLDEQDSTWEWVSAQEI